jgi:TonB family protein
VGFRVPPDDAYLRLPEPAAPAAEASERALFAIDRTATDLPEDARSEPSFDAGPALVGFDEPQPIEPEREPDRLDPQRAMDEAEPAAPKRARRGRLLGLVGSLCIHLLPLLLLLHWSAAPADIAAPMPVTLVLEQPPPPPPSPEPVKPPPEAKPPQPGLLASVDIGDPKAPRDKPADAPEPAAEQPNEPQVATAAPLPKPTPPPELTSALPKPAPPPQPDLKPAEPEPTPPVKRPVKQAAAPQPLLRPSPHPARASFGIPGPSASRDEYLAYCMTLVRQHYGVLPASFLAGRRGITVLKILVLGDGTIARVDVAHHSGYSDVDNRVEQMVAAVRRFPPLPQWIQQPSVTLTFELAFPEGLLEQ